MSPAPDIPGNLQRVLDGIAEAASAANRRPADVQLVAVSKTKPASAVSAAHESGQRHFGENRIQELTAKQPKLPADIQWHMIGHLQSNKAKDAIGVAQLIHSVDSGKLLRRLDRLAGEATVRQRLLLQINVSGEPSKYGLEPAEVSGLVEEALSLEHVELKGFMTMAPLDADTAALRRIFAKLRQLRDEQQEKLGIVLPELSMGMSGDYREAIAEGATLVRIGSAIFGSREG